MVETPSPPGGLADLQDSAGCTPSPWTHRGVGLREEAGQHTRSARVLDPCGSVRSIRTTGGQESPSSPRRRRVAAPAEGRLWDRPHATGQPGPDFGLEVEARTIEGACDPHAGPRRRQRPRRGCRRRTLSLELIARIALRRLPAQWMRRIQGLTLRRDPPARTGREGAASPSRAVRERIATKGGTHAGKHRRRPRRRPSTPRGSRATTPRNSAATRSGSRSTRPTRTCPRSSRDCRTTAASARTSGTCSRARSRSSSPTARRSMRPATSPCAASGHTPVLYDGTELVEFSSTADLAQTMEVVARNAAAMGAHDSGAGLSRGGSPRHLRRRRGARPHRRTCARSRRHGRRGGGARAGPDWVDVAIWNTDGLQAEMSGNATRIAPGSRRRPVRSTTVRVGLGPCTRACSAGRGRTDLGKVRVGAAEEADGIRASRRSTSATRTPSWKATPTTCWRSARGSRCIRASRSAPTCRSHGSTRLGGHRSRGVCVRRRLLGHERSRRGRRDARRRRGGRELSRRRPSCASPRGRATRIGPAPSGYVAISNSRSTSFSRRLEVVEALRSPTMSAHGKPIRAGGVVLQPHTR